MRLTKYNYSRRHDTFVHNLKLFPSVSINFISQSLIRLHKELRITAHLKPLGFQMVDPSHANKPLLKTQSRSLITMVTETKPKVLRLCKRLLVLKKPSDKCRFFHLQRRDHKWKKNKLSSMYVVQPLTQCQKLSQIGICANGILYEHCSSAYLFDLTW